MLNTAPLSPEDMDRFNAGEPKALTLIMNIWYKAICYFAQQLVSKEDAEEIASDTFVKLWNLRSNFKESANVKAFLYLTTRNACLNKLRNLNHEKLRIAQLPDLEDETAEQTEIRTEMIAVISKELNNLSGKNGEVLRLLILQNLSNKEVAEKMGMNVVAVRKAKSRGLTELKINVMKNSTLALLIYILMNPITILCFLLRKLWP